jgi:hypothetical protein
MMRIRSWTRSGAATRAHEAALKARQREIPAAGPDQGVEIQFFPVRAGPRVVAVVLKPSRTAGGKSKKYIAALDDVLEIFQTVRQGE